MRDYDTYIILSSGNQSVTADGVSSGKVVLGIPYFSIPTADAPRARLGAIPKSIARCTNNGRNPWPETAYFSFTTAAGSWTVHAGLFILVHAP